MAKPPALIDGLDPKVWDALARSLARTASRDIEALVAGKPIRRGAEARLRSLVVSLKQLYGLTTDEAWVAARTLGPQMTALSRSLDRVLASVPNHAMTAVSSATEYVAARGIPVILNEKAVTSIALRATQAITADWTRLAAGAQRAVADTLRSAIVGGTGARDAAAAMYRGTYGQTGLTYSRALTIARTEIADAYDEANLQTYADAGVERYSWYASLDDRTCAMCQALHGSVFPMWKAPAKHHNCRCEMLPVFPGERVGSDGRLPGTRVPNEQIAARLPSTWDVPADPRDLIGETDVAGWRSVKRLVKP